jgi:membrane protease YdiL (CAAX protease family)
MSKDYPDVKQKTEFWDPWAWLGLVVALLALLGSQIIIGLGFIFYAHLRSWSSTQANDWLNSSILGQFIFILLSEIAAVSLIVYFLKKSKLGLKYIGLRKPKWMDPVYGLIALPVYLVSYVVITAVITHFVHINTNQKQQLGFNNVHGSLELFLTFISLVILPPIAEEIIFRGLTYSSLKKIMPLWGAVVGTSLLFAAGHLAEGGSVGPLYIAGIDTFILSLVLIFLREKTNGLWASMTLHALKNSIAFVALFALHLG